MSIIRFSADRDELFIPDDTGKLIDTPYSPPDLTGKIGSFPRAAGFDSNDPTGTVLRVHLDAILERQAAQLDDDEPVVVMVHGFLFNPYETPVADRTESDNPHVRIYHFEMPEDQSIETEKHNTAWPLQLGFADGDQGAAGLAIGFGWYSSPGLASSLFKGAKNHYSRAYDYGTDVAFTLLNLLHHLHEALAAAGKDNRVDIFCHSLGSHVVVQSIISACKENRRLAQKLEAAAEDGPLVATLKRLDRIVILGGAEYVREAQVLYDEVNRNDLNLANTESCFVYNVGCRENDVLDTLAENFGPIFFGNSQVIGHNGLAHSDPYKMWMDLQIDSPKLAEWLAKPKFKLSILGDGPGIADHWHYYTHRPNMAMYKGIFRDRTKWNIAALRKGPSPIPEGIKVGFWGD